MKWLTVKLMYRCQRNMVSQGTITKANGKFEITIYGDWNRNDWNVFRNNVSSFWLQGQQNILFPANLATPET